MKTGRAARACRFIGLGLLLAAVLPAHLANATQHCDDLRRALQHRRDGTLDTLRDRAIEDADAARDPTLTLWASRLTIAGFDRCVLSICNNAKKAVRKVNCTFSCERDMASVRAADEALKGAASDVGRCFPGAIERTRTGSGGAILQVDHDVHEVAVRLRTSTKAGKGVVILEFSYAELYRQLVELESRYFALGPESGEQLALSRKMMELAEQVYGPSHAKFAEYVNRHASAQFFAGTYEEAAKLYKRAIAAWDASDKSIDFKLETSLGYLAFSLYRLGRSAERVLVLERHADLVRSSKGPLHADTIGAIQEVAVAADAAGDVRKGDRLLEEIAAAMAAAGRDDQGSLEPLLVHMATRQRDGGNDEEALRLYRRAAALEPDRLRREVGLGDVSKALIFQEPRSTIHLADFLTERGRHREAEHEFLRGLRLMSERTNEKSLATAPIRIRIAEFYRDRGRHDEALAMFRVVGAIYAAHPKEEPDGWDVQEFAEGTVLRLQGRHQDAAALLEKAYERFGAREYADERARAQSAVALQLVPAYRHLRRFDDARALAAKHLAPLAQPPDPGGELRDLALRLELGLLERDAGRPHEANAQLARANDTLRHYNQESLARQGERAFVDPQIAGYVAQMLDLHWSVASAAPALTTDSASRTFLLAQSVASATAGKSISQMAARTAAQTTAVGELVRVQQDLQRRRAALAQGLALARTGTGTKALIDRDSAEVRRIDQRLQEIDARIAGAFPTFEEFVRPLPLSPSAVTDLLSGGEALAYVHTQHGHTYTWVVTRTGMRWVRSDLGTPALAREVAALRCGLDVTAWDGSGSDRCAAAVGLWTGGSQPLPFDHTRAHALYKALFGEVEDLIKGKRLLIVSSGPLTQLPLQVLVTAPPGPLPSCGKGPEAGRSTTAKEQACLQDQRTIAWLARDHAITILPAVSSLKALRRVGKPSAAPLPMIGFGNPLLDGPHGGHAERAKLARDKKTCPETALQRIAALLGLRGGAAPIATRGGLADPAHLKMQIPLPETADELCAVARDVNADPRDMRLGARATEQEVKRLSAQGELAKYRVLHFATHGTLAGQLDAIHEPGLILTPPDKATEEDDGYLSASEIAGLKLDADWVILSACNTAAGGAAGAEALSGLARAFFYAQARALLVSHWEVNSHSTVKLITAAVRETARDANVGRAEALRRAMLALIDKGEPYEAHPAYWAPFVVVGEGAAQK